ncbi:MAG: hypothetical protein WDZ89_02105 [Gemmatimonadota bacterium]
MIECNLARTSRRGARGAGSIARAAACVTLVLAPFLSVATASAQQPDSPNTKLPSTLRYGSGYLDVPAATVLPHLTFTGTYSAFRAGLRRVGADGGEPLRSNEWMSDGSLALGLFDRAEAGLTFQSFGGDGGKLIGGFGQLALLRPGERGLGFAVGGRYVSSPSFDDAPGSQPTRLGFADPRFRREEGGPAAGLSTSFTPYGIATVLIPGGELPLVPPYDLSLSLGYGGGLFSGGTELDHYAGSSSGGWIGGAAAHVELGENLLLNLIGDYNGFDLNTGVQLDFGGLRAGVFILGTNYGEDLSAYRSRKVGFVASVAACPAGSRSGSFLDRVRCWPSLIDERADADTVRLPAPPPDTVIVVREVAPAPPPGRSEELCLSTGQSVPVRITADGDILVGPDFVSIGALRSTLVFAGSYAEGREWYRSGAVIDFDEAEYRMEDGPRTMSCGEIMRVGEFQGIPLFAGIDDFPPFVVLYVPVRPGEWQTYVRRPGGSASNR